VSEFHPPNQNRNTLSKPVPGKRLDLGNPKLNGLAKTALLFSSLDACLPNPRLVRAVEFFKHPSKSWALGWHQDRVISVPKKFEAAGYKNWTRKQGGWHCEPPTAILENLVFATFLLSDVTEENGPMEIAVGSHHLGVVSDNKAQEHSEKFDKVKVTGKAGDVFLVKGLTLHRSLKAMTPSHRHSLRLDFSNASLSNNPLWGWQVKN
jgi:ectoine hydroxylase-related dioxygenase (phytanoyl-CoA dioxygenase family)